MIGGAAGIRGSRRSRPALATWSVLLAMALASLPAFGPSLRAQERERPRPPPGPRVLQLTTSTRALALGGAFWTGGGGGAHAIFHHPALISGQGFDISVGGPYSRDDDVYAALSASGAWWGGTVATGLAVFDYGASPGLDALREAARTPAERARLAGALRARPATTEFVGSVAYTRELLGFGVGAAVKLVGQTVGGVRGRTGAVDLGLSRGIGRVDAALTLQNMGPDLELGGRHVPLPLRLVLGAGTGGRLQVGPLDIGAAVQVAHERSGDIVPGGGVEIAYWPIQRRVFIARIGAARVVEGDGLPVTLGAGFEGDRFRLDYSYSEHDPIAGPHRIGISIR